MEPEQPLGSHLLHRLSQASTGRTGLLFVDNKLFFKSSMLYSLQSVWEPGLPVALGSGSCRTAGEETAFIAPGAEGSTFSLLVKGSDGVTLLQ